jgi:hypothetical protein
MPVVLIARVIVRALPFWILTVTDELPGVAVTADVDGLGADASQTTVCPDEGAPLLHAACASLLKNITDAAGASNVENIKAPIVWFAELLSS